MDVRLIATKFDQTAVQKKFGVDCVVTPLKDGSGAIVVEPMRVDQQSNATMVDLRGERRVGVELPASLKGGLGFADAYYVNDELTAIYVCAGRDFACVIDESSGTIKRFYETR